MSWIIWLSIIQIALVRIIGILRKIGFDYCLKENGYKTIKKPLKVRVSNFIISILQSAMPFYGILLIFITLFINDETLLKTAIDNKLVEKE